MLTGLAVGFYDGALGPGTGSFFVVILVGLLGYSFLEGSANARLANWATNVAALCVFVPQRRGALEGRPGHGRLQRARRLRRRPDRGRQGRRVRPGLLHRGRHGVRHPDRRRPRGSVVSAPND